jgi:hypothetical protein
MLLLPTEVKAAVAGGTALALLLTWLAVSSLSREPAEPAPAAIQETPLPEPRTPDPAPPPVPPAVSVAPPPETGTAKEDETGKKIAAREHRVSIETRPRGAKVWSEGVLIGVTPLQLAITGDRTRTVRISMPGYEEIAADISAEDGTRMFQLTRLPRPRSRPARRRASPRKESTRATPAAADNDPQPPKATGASPYEKFE